MRVIVVQVFKATPTNETFRCQLNLNSGNQNQHIHRHLQPRLCLPDLLLACSNLAFLTTTMILEWDIITTNLISSTSMPKDRFLLPLQTDLPNLCLNLQEFRLRRAC